MKREAEEWIKYESPLSEEDAVFLNSVYRARYPAALGLLPTGEPTKEDAERAFTVHGRYRSGLKRFWIDRGKGKRVSKCQ